MSLSRPRIAFPVMVICGSLYLVILGAIVSVTSRPTRFTPRPSDDRRLPIAAPVTQVVTSAQPTSQVPDIVVALSGTLQQSIPPNWTFVQQVDQPTDLPFLLKGTEPTQDIRIRSLGAATNVRILDYQVTDLSALEKDLSSKTSQEVALGKRTVRMVSMTNGKGIRGLVLEGSSEVVVLWAEDNASWASLEVIPGELRTLAQSLRVQ